MGLEFKIMKMEYVISLAVIIQKALSIMKFHFLSLKWAQI
jgi:hypothetical protein